jgi:malonyl-CoA decarboxylase
MNTSSIFGDMLQTIAERGRRLLSLGRQPLPAGVGDLERACENLISRRGEASGMALAGDILERWRRSDDDDRRAFMAMLLEKFGPDPERLERAIEAYREERSPRTLRELHVAAEPRRQELIRRLNLAPNGIATLVQMREALLDQKAVDPDRPMCWKRSYGTRPCTRLATGTNCAAGSTPKTAAASPSFIRSLSTSR